MPWASIHYLPLSVFVLLPATFIVSYIVAIILGDVEVEFPYISDTGTHSPESCLFSQLLNIVSFLTTLTIYVRYKQIEQYYRDHLTPESTRILSRNFVSLCIGFVSCFGLSVVANFQETNLFKVHMVGAMACFGFGCVYCWMQCFLSYKMVPLVNTRHVAHIRLLLCLIMSCSFMTSSVCGPLAYSYFDKTKDPTNWKRHDGGYALHVTSSIAEWISAMSLDFFILTYVREMHKISLGSPRVFFIIESNVALGEESFYQTDDNVEVIQSHSSGNMFSGLMGSQDDVHDSYRQFSTGSQAIIH